tara:strand:+ start:995 stop:1585 length:591 start_codon:yes stop_codon:yes gene_type:complete
MSKLSPRVEGVKSPTKVIYDYLISLQGDALIRACDAHEPYKKICSNDSFWREKVRHDFGKVDYKMRTSNDSPDSWKNTWEVLSKNRIKIVVGYSILDEKNLEDGNLLKDMVGSFDDKWLKDLLQKSTCSDKISLEAVVVVKNDKKLELIFMFDRMDRQKCMNLLVELIEEWSFEGKYLSKDDVWFEFGPVYSYSLI